MTLLWFALTDALFLQPVDRCRDARLQLRDHSIRLRREIIQNNGLYFRKKVIRVSSSVHIAQFIPNQSG
jgi:hypothetical protein